MVAVTQLLPSRSGCRRADDITHRAATSRDGADGVRGDGAGDAAGLGHATAAQGRLIRMIKLQGTRRRIGKHKRAAAAGTIRPGLLIIGEDTGPGCHQAGPEAGRRRARGGQGQGVKRIGRGSIGHFYAGQRPTRRQGHRAVGQGMFRARLHPRMGATGGGKGRRTRGRRNKNERQDFIHRRARVEVGGGQGKFAANRVHGGQTGSIRLTAGTQPPAP